MLVQRRSAAIALLQLAPIRPRLYMFIDESDRLCA